MNQINTLFKNKKEKIFSLYFPAGYPKLEDTTQILSILKTEKVDMVEIGIPFSDPLADGPVIQAAAQQALKNGMTLKLLFQQLKSYRNNAENPAILLMGYLNSVLQFGMEDFLKECQLSAVSGVILPDLPPEKFREKYEDLFKKYGIINVFLITPETSSQRLHYIDMLSQGFIYAVSSSSTTGSEKDFEGQQNYFKRLQEEKLRHPIMVGFGIHDHDTFRQATQYQDGGIIGTAFIQALTKKGNSTQNIKAFIAAIKRK